MFKRKSFLSGLALVALLMSATNAFAASSTGTIAVGMTETSECAITTSPLSFGNIASLQGATAYATTTINFGCTNSTPYTVSMDSGTGPGATAIVRVMVNQAGNTLDYVLYQDAAHSTAWATGSSAYSGTGGGNSSVAHGVYALLNGGQNPPPGNYTDTVTVTVAY